MKKENRMRSLAVPDGGCDDAGRLRRQCGYGRYGRKRRRRIRPLPWKHRRRKQAAWQFPALLSGPVSPQEQVSIIPLVSRRGGGGQF